MRAPTSASPAPSGGVSSVRRAGAEDHPSDDDLLVGTPCAPECFDLFYRRHVRNMLAYHYKRTGDVDVAADLTAETFAAALYAVRNYDPAKGTGTQWLYGIARNQLLQFWRHAEVSQRLRRKLQMTVIEIDPISSDELERIETLADAAPAAETVAQLPATLRDAVRLRVLDGRDYTFIASELGCTVVAARLQVFRGLRRLQEELDDA